MFSIFQGGIKGFSTNENNVLKWCLSRPQQAINMNRLKEQAGVAHHQSIYKPLRISQIERSESLVSKVVNVLENNFLNPFAIALDGEELVNLSSGEKFHGDTTELLNIWKNGRDLYQQFLKQRIYTNEKGFHDPISRQKQVLFSTRQNKPKQENKTQIITANRNILGKLLSLSLRSQQQIDFSKALGYSLYPVPLSLSFPDGTRRQTQKSKLLEVLSIKNHQTLSDKKASTLVIDIIAQFRSLTRVPETFEDFIIQFLDVIPKSYIRVDIVADCYREVSIKSSEREKRGQSSKVLIGSVRSKVPRDIAKFFSCSANKTQLIDLTFNYVLENTTKVLAMLQATCIILSGDNLCHEVRSTGCFQKMSLCSDQEEADTKVVLHALDALANNSSNVVIRSPSGDTDIFVIALGVVRETSRIKFDYGSGINRKAIWLNEVAIPVNYSKALIGFHAFTGNDYVSAFFRKGKSRCWKTMVKSARYLEAFNTLGDQWELSDELKLTLEEYVCNLYSSSKNYVNETRFDMFMENQIVKNQIVDLSILPPCKSSLLLHIERANYVAKLWKMSPVNLINAPPFNNHGWHCDGSINWVNEQYPDDISELLINDENDSEEYGDDDDNEYGDGFDE